MTVSMQCAAVAVVCVVVRLSVGSGCASLLVHRTVMRLEVSRRWIRLSRSSVQLPPLTVSPQCPEGVLVRCCCPCLDMSLSALPQSTFVCPSVVDASHCLSTVLSCGWWSVDVGATVTVQRTARRLGLPTLATINTTATVTVGA